MNITGRITVAALLSIATAFSTVACARPSNPPSASPTTASASTTQSPASSPSPSSSPAPATTTVPPVVPGTGDNVVAVRVAYQWHWPNDQRQLGRVTHTIAVPPVPRLVRIGAADHAATAGERRYDRMSFTFTTGFPSYRFEYVERLIADASGKPVPLPGRDVLRVIFTPAQAHTDNGQSSITSRPDPHLGLSPMVAYAPAGDFESVLTYGIGLSRSGSASQALVRAYEVTRRTPAGGYEYVVAIDVAPIA